MEHLIETIQGALAPDATDEARAAGANACREIQRSLEPEVPSAPTAAAPHPAAQLAQLVTALRGVPMEQLLDLAITKLRTMVPSATNAAPGSGLRFTLVPIAHGMLPAGVPR